MKQKQKTHKMQAEDLRKDLQTFLYSERQVRDLLLYYTPSATLQKYQRVIKEIKAWFDSGKFLIHGKDYFFSPSLFKEALKILRTQPGFTPPGNESTGYLKKTMRTLLERKQQQRKAAGVHVVSQTSHLQDAGETPALPGGLPGNKGGFSLKIVANTNIYKEHLGRIVKNLCYLKLKELKTVKGIDVSEVKATLEEALETGTVSKGFFETLDLHLMETVREQIGKEWENLRQEVTAWFAEYRNVWTDDVMQETIETGFRERLNERYGVPIWR